MASTLNEVLNDIIANLRFALDEATVLNTSSAAGNTGADVVIRANNDLVGLKAFLTVKASTPGLAAYLQAQYNNGALNVATAFNNLQTAITNSITQTGALVSLGAQYSINGTTKLAEPVTFAPATTANLRTSLVALISAINAILP